MSTGEWAIAVYQDTYNDYIMAELFEWRSSTNSFNSYSTIKIYQGGINVKIDGFWDSSTGDRWMLVWNKDDQLAVFATAGYYDFNAAIVLTAAVSRLFLSFYKNGNEYSRGADFQSATGSVQNSTFMQLDAGDTVTARYYVNNNVNISNSILTQFSGKLVSVA